MTSESKRKGDKKMKKFVYDVAGFEFEDTEAFGKAWREAKAKATELHVPIYRTVIKTEERREVYYNGGCFNSIQFATADNVKVW